jgi:SET domain-containing protein
MPDVVVKASPIHGTGVYAAADLQKGAAVLRIDDSRRVTLEDPLDESKGEFDYHCDYLADGRVVLMRPPERHINHSCDPNTFVRTILGVRYVFALRRIPAGEEITYDYCINGFGDTLWECRCGSTRCRLQIHSDFFHLPLELQLEYLPLLDDWYVGEYREKVAELLRSVGVS